MKKRTGIAAAEYGRRRRQLMKIVGEQGIVVLPAAPERVRSRDTHYPYRQDSDFWYLCGFPEPDAVLILIPGRSHGQVVLFCRDRDPEREVWDGPRAGYDGAIEHYGVDDAYPIDDLDEILPGFLEGRRRIYYYFGRDVEFDLRLIGWVNRVREQVRHAMDSPHEFVDLGLLLHEQRLFKSCDEIALLQCAADISVEAHWNVLRYAHPNVPEYVLQAEVERVFRAADSCPAYPSIVAAGANACVLHYHANAECIRDGDLVLIDAGAEYRGYAADITRTFPVNGRFSSAQRVLYDLVGAAHSAALAHARPGLPYEAGHFAAVETLTEGLLQLGLLHGTLEQNLADHGYKRFYRHKTGHWLGLDVHDVGEYRIDSQSRLLEPGMVFTIEPGLYISKDDTTVQPKWRGIGIRTEDDVLITEDGHRVLTDALPRSADEIEAKMAAAR
ncbi:MAG TPA: aminopeptidase P N-terminal domain-containing protein [Xylella sp.]